VLSKLKEELGFSYVFMNPISTLLDKKFELTAVFRFAMIIGYSKVQPFQFRDKT